MNRTLDTAQWTQQEWGRVLGVLRSIDEGHIGLLLQVAYFDSGTGEKLDSPRVLRPTPCPDRDVPPLPLPRQEWWLDLAELGWLRLPREREPQRWIVTDEALALLEKHGMSRP